MLGPAQSAVAVKNLDFRVTQSVQASRCQLGQLLVPLDGVDLAHHFGKHGCRISGAGPDLQGAIARARHNALDHERDYVRLRNGLAGRDRQGRILVSEFGEFIGEESLARDASHGLEHRSVAHSASSNLISDHPKAFVCQVKHDRVLPKLRDTQGKSITCAISDTTNKCDKFHVRGFGARAIVS